MNGTWKDLLAFNKRERNGIFVLILLIVLVSSIQVVLPLFKPVYPAIDESEYLQFVAQLKQDSITYEQLKTERKLELKRKYLAQNRKKYPRYTDGNKEKKKQVWKPVVFNPNDADVAKWMQFGLSLKQAQSIEKYKNKGATFREKSDVRKLFVINEELYQLMKPFIHLPDSLPPRDFFEGKEGLKKSKLQTNDNPWIDLNTTDTTELKKLRGVGSYYARQIIWYRDKLGGYYSRNQLYEIERMRPETVQKIWPFVWVDSNKIIKIHVNSTTAPEMVKHPYFTWNMAISIQDYRDFTKKFKSTHQLVEIGLLNEEIYSKLAPYLEL